MSRISRCGLLAVSAAMIFGCQETDSGGVVREAAPVKSRELASGLTVRSAEPALSARPDLQVSSGSAPVDPAPSSATRTEGKPGVLAEPVSPEPADSSAVLLALALKEGDTFRFVNTTSGTTESTGPASMNSRSKEAPKPRTSQLDMSSESTVKVTAVEGGVASINLKTGNVRVNAEANDPAAQMVQNMAKAAEGREVTLKYRRNGRMADERASVNMMQMSDSLGNFFGFMGLTYPDDPVRVGDSWKSELDLAKLAAGGSASGMTWSDARLPAQYTLRSIDRKAGTATIEFSIQGSPVMTLRMPDPPKDADGKPKTVQNPPRELKMTMSFQVTGRTVVDIATGLPRESKSTSQVTTSSPMMGTMKQRLTTTTKRA
jgi:hypothetical protein